MNKEILDKVTEIVSYIKETDAYKNYLKASEKLQNDEELMTLIEKIKMYQKEIVRNKDRKDLEEKIKACLEKLNNSLVYLQYMEYQEEVNNMLTIFENKINKYFEDVFN